jgi:hypothetical protein
VVEQKVYWPEANQIDRAQGIVDSDEAFQDHYRWWHQHPLQRRRRFTLKADPIRSFQPQTNEGTLIDVVPFLAKAGLSLDKLRLNLRAGYNSKPMKLGDLAEALYDWLNQCAAVKLTGSTLAALRRANP